ncbi:probable serine/threonine-protein kinase At1g54610 isoform X2 [Daucus carota subsp. sativus]|uniref:probable serine/threonine-protein kinase At1g54610 isoform X2 n=1 Tax=Daucus carota subsp. sativus TaxID=79200 RepID=UPI0007EFFAF8|nr:PREDICTED: probable serine/threonine-protein kinase At1g54610 isoform X2 [Daucus carota subsp. sativus]
MGGLCGKPSSPEGERRESPKSRQGALVLSRGNSGKRVESFRAKDKRENGDARVGYIDKRTNNSRRVRDEQSEKKKTQLVDSIPASISSAAQAELIAAGWPSWLVAAAAESIKGWIPRRADTFEKLEKIGQGTYSSVYKARDVLNKKFVALKRVRFDNLDRESVKFMAREILILRRLDHPNIIKLEGLVTSRTSSSLYLVFEYMEHDLTGLASLPGVKFTEPQVKCYMQQLLSGLDHCHSHGVLHRDIKGSNLLIDDNGILKIADFGLASFFEHRQSAPLTSHVVTLWYRPPELLLGATYYGVAIDLWSSGCILGELYAGKPIMPGRTEVEQLHKIFKLCGSPSEDYWKKSKLHKSTVFKPKQPYRRRLAETFKDFPDAAVGLIETLLAVDPAQRGTAASALKSEFFIVEPHACDPATLPKYPPSKEIDAKLRGEEARRQGVGIKDDKVERDTSRPRDSRAVPAPDANAELATSLQKRGRSNPKTRSEQFNRQKDEAASGFPIGPPRATQASKEGRKEQIEQPPNRASYSGPLVPGVGWTKAAKKNEAMPVVLPRTNLSSLSGLVASRTLTSEDSRDKFCPPHQAAADQARRVSETFDEWGSARKQDIKHQTQGTTGSRQMGNLLGSTKESILGFQGKGNKIHFSGPLLVPSNNVDQMLKDHDRQIQEAARRARIEKARVGIIEPQVTPNPMYVGNRGAR